jgi:membrane protein DedA with SNARE-associated domain
VEQWLVEHLTRYGPPVLFLAQVLGIFGLPIPDELLMTLAGALVRRGTMHATATLAAAIGGSASGITLSYVLGRTVGSAALHRLAHVPDDAFARTQRWFARFGHWLLTFGYFIPGVRHVTAIAAGAAPMSYAAFARAAYPGAVLWCLVFVGLGYWAGERGAALLALFHSHVRTTTALLAVVVAAGILARWIWTARTGTLPRAD